MGQDNTESLVTLPNMTYYFISGHLPKNYGGLTKSLLLRSKLFGRLQQKETHFLTFGFDLTLRKKVESLYQESVIDPNYTVVVNMYEDFLSDVSHGKRTYQEKLDIEQIQKLAHQNKVIKKLKELIGTKQNKIKVTYYKNEQTIKSVSFLNEEMKVIKKEDYAEDNRLSVVSFFEPRERDPYLVEYVNRDQIVYLEKRYVQDPATNETKLSMINWYADDKMHTFTDEIDLCRHWTKAIQSNSEEPKLFLVDSRPQDKHVFEVPKSKNSYYAAIIHNKHYGENKHHIKGRYKKLMAHRFDLDAIFFITNEQLEDFYTLTGPQPHYYFTPHTMDRELDESVLRSKKNPNKAVIISRLVNMKNIEDAVSAFAIVAQKIPAATLEIYGTGEEKQAIKAKIDELQLNNNVFLKGHTNDPDGQFQSAALTISTSHYEGFGLSNMEALVNGCPVVTYDYDYGAKNLVKDGVNGYIVEQYNIEALANKIIELMVDEEKHDDFAKNAFESASRYSPENYITYWSKALNQMMKNRNTRTEFEKKVKDLTFELEHPPKFDNTAVSFTLECNKTPITNIELALVAIDRKYKEDVVRVPLHVSEEGLSVDVDPKALYWEAIESNNVKKIDFYVEVKKSGEGNVVMKRISSKVVKEFRTVDVNGIKIESYSTKYKNYSWSL